MGNHTITDCAQGPTIDKMSNVLDRVVIALETIAEHGARVSGLENLVAKNEHDLRELFGRVRMIENGKAKATDVTALDLRVRTIELATATETGAKVVAVEKEKFWDGVKIQLADKILLFGIFIILAADRLDVGMWVAKLWKEIFG